MTENVKADECFYICPIGPPGSEVRKRSNQIFKYVVRDTLQPLNYTVSRADEIDQSGIITTQIIEGLLSADLVVADLSDQNPNVFYELAVRHAVRKPFVQLMTDGQKLPFDIQGLRTIYIDHTDLDSVAEAKLTLTGMVASIREGRPVDTPLTYTLDLQTLRQSDDSEARGIAEIISEIQGLKQIVRSSKTNTSRLGEGFTASDFKQLRNLFLVMAEDGALTPMQLRILSEEPLFSSHFVNWVRKVLIPAAEQSGPPSG